MQNAKIKNQNDNVKCKMIKNSNSKSQIPNKFKIKIFKIQKFAKQIFKFSIFNDQFSMNFQFSNYQFLNNLNSKF